MSLFQNTVVKKYTNAINKLVLDEKWQLFTTIFHNAAKQQNIRNSKEEQYQAIFLNDLFVQVLGYTQHPNTNYNLITEQKNETNSKKADGAIILNENVHAVIELKGTETTDLSKIETQAFGYKNNQKQCSYVIISNFEKLRFYVDNATEFVEFNLFTLSRDEFNLLFLCLSLESMQTDLPKKIKYESVSSEDKITKELYKDYSAFRTALFSDIVQLNPQYNQPELFKKTQKLLDRFLFIFFAEDRQLLPTNLIFSINLEWQKLREARIPVSLYDRYKMYFNDLNTGARVSLPAFGKHTNEIVTAQYDIYAYNGGLFQPDDLLDNIAVNDDLLFKHTRKLSEYDFESEVDVNILGHIFENSLNEIDEITNAIAGQVTDKTKTKRKKDGVFYTPKYITKYIVDNTIGKLCEEKKVEIALDETKYSTDKKINVTTKKKLKETLDNYRNWLLQLTIVDPACGSGAFLSQALEFLIAEHKYVDELQAKLFGDALVLSDVEGSILENNLFGVDLNEESVEIAKLSLWLRTAQRNRKLNSLNNNIKCGNSLIDDVAIAGDKAFNWQNEFPKVFANEGFDVVIGNPPYVRNTMLKNVDKEYFSTKYESAHQQYDLYVLFTELGLNILKQKSYLSYIIPNKFIATNYGLKNRKFILENSLINEIKDISNENIFIDASVYPVIINLKKNEFKKIDDKTYDIISFKTKTNYNYSFIEKLSRNSLSLINICSITETIHTGNVREKLIIDEKLNSKCKPLLRGRDLDRYSINPDLNLFVNFDNDLILKENGEYANLTNSKLYENEKILIRDISLRLQAYYDDEKYYTVNTLYSLLINNKSIEYKYLLSILNSNLISFWFKSKFNDAHVSGGYLRFKKKYVSQIPIEISKNQQPFIEKADSMLSLNKELQEVTQKFSKYFSGQFKIEKRSGKLEKWYGLSFEDFIKEINKAIKTQKGTPLTKKEEFDWIDLFEENKVKANKLQNEIAATDKAIDAMVYELYGLSEEEIGIVEGNVIASKAKQTH
ncbi:Eco57I restriction-modification methylase domain-containing protein [Flavobacterium sp. RSP15]|uniref:Eco57I restriction-modification methylase domain-containing protein n=1 Tax=Flavobacterium sp. RSP15 TaxID=2497485 RepID=UPI000F818E5F|nr:TaqI-like C-terminal specificity domain-containing protein [Flavobacterium sp. RSP15]RTY88426.1 restriction endonuclease subunit M [Flavobacterium sp. RSP15]